ncbi:MAG TPA: rod shape-determining protein MreD [Spirochaetales bacterium]|nr:rod shape-determining protein MreD [Spirochaetales bacterium]HPG87057.1 rod shape-determining protein MreD [Spirochaetales bacterium]HPM72842.1 rod shape-determining protein MreD [Spirochaetales bacterium]
MIRRWLASLALVSLLIVVQSTWLGVIAVYSVLPDLSLIAVVYIAFKSPNLQGQGVGFVAGLLQDGISAAPFGLNAFVKTAVAWLANLLSGKFYIDRLLMPALFGFSMTLAKAAYLAVLASLFSGKITGYDFLGSTLWIEAAYNAVVAPFMFMLLGFLDRFIVPRDAR